MTEAERALIEAALALSAYEQKDVHCGWTPETSGSFMDAVQRAAEAVLAERAKMVATDEWRVMAPLGRIENPVSERLYRSADGREEWRPE
jgi:hypothetical protein